MTTATIPQLTYSGKPIAMDQVGELRRSDDITDDRDALWERMEEDGYFVFAWIFGSTRSVGGAGSIVRSPLQVRGARPGTSADGKA